MKVTIASGKGGTGKTTVAVNLAVWMAQEGRRVILTDLDVEEPNSALFLEGKETARRVVYRRIPQWDAARCERSGNCAAVCMYNAIAFTGEEVIVFPELCHGCYACSDLCPSQALPMVDDRIGEIVTRQVSLSGGAGIVHVEGRLDVGREMPTPLIAETVRHAERLVREEDTMLLYDAPPGTSCPMMEAAKGADLVLLVAEPTRFGRHDLSLAIETLRMLGRPFAVVVNKDRPGVTLIDELCADKEVPVVARIPHLTEAARLYAGGALLVDRVPQVREAVASLGHYLQTWEKGGGQR